MECRQVNKGWKKTHLDLLSEIMKSANLEQYKKRTELN